MFDEAVIRDGIRHTVSLIWPFWAFLVFAVAITKVKGLGCVNRLVSMWFCLFTLLSAGASWVGFFAILTDAMGLLALRIFLPPYDEIACLLSFVLVSGLGMGILAVGFRRIFLWLWRGHKLS